MSMAIKGNRITEIVSTTLNYPTIFTLLIQRGANTNLTYREPKHGQDYTCTPIIHCIRTKFDSVAHKSKTIDSLMTNGGTCATTDSDGKDAFIYCAMNNDIDSFT